MAVVIIAEAGVNHNGQLDLAFQLIDAAANAGVDFVKFQTFKTELAISKKAVKAAYQIENTANATETQFEMVKKLELSAEDHEAIIAYCQQKGVAFFSTAFDLESMDYLASLGLKMVKIPSGEVTNLPLLQKAASLFEEVILSTGMCTMPEIQEAVAVFEKAGIPREKITILHCNTEYPTPMEDVNLKAMLSIQNTMGTAVGYSDHTLGIEVPIAAVALGATVIEKHFTLNKNMEGPDHRASLEPDELVAMTKAIRNIEKAMAGDGIKQPSPSEIKNIAIARKSIVARTFIPKGAVFTEENLITKRPGIGLSPMRWHEVIGQTAQRDYQEDELIEL
ncbi:N-acetylneuraminate synthase [Flavobacterium sp.]|jgi:N,N'-diacetyllegionaminate synthase|uniref:N-acetylneuraminate synthase n=1 Tax=Flavobacterium sp. TaxID=239 RepID=UPI0022C2C56B|nr:N-acetylneuraminate synthase [Flavobacterium sp.]MCZ8144139.1 N-acetylneuraminate synthase [Flavobacterium sp.]MCZ8366240.1 N-acetylneuraminate synthase [Flavobacterium sp.]